MKKIYKKENLNLFGMRPTRIDWQYNTITGNYAINPQDRDSQNLQHRKR